MPRQFVGELKDGDQIEETYLLAEKQLRANRNADLYLLSQLRDKSGTISGLMWNVSESHLESPQGVRLERLPSHNVFWFAWYNVFPSTRLVK